MPVLVKCVEKVNHAWLKRVLDIISDHKPELLPDAYAKREYSRNKFDKVSNQVDVYNCANGVTEKLEIERLLALQRSWSGLKPTILSCIPQKNGFLASAARKIFLDEKDKQHMNLIAYYMNKVMDIYGIIYHPDYREHWVKNDEIYNILTTSIEYLLNQMGRDLVTPISSLQSNTLPFALVDNPDNVAQFQLFNNRATSSEPTVVGLTAEQQARVSEADELGRQLALVSNELEETRTINAQLQKTIQQQQALVSKADGIGRQFELVSKELEKSRAQNAQLQETIDRLTGVIEKVKPALENAKRERDALQSKLAETQGALKETNELVEELMAKPIGAVSALRAQSQFPPSSGENNVGKTDVSPGKRN